MRTVIIIPDDLWERAKERAIQERTSLAGVIRKALEEYLKVKKVKEKKGGK